MKLDRKANRLRPISKTYVKKP